MNDGRKSVGAVSCLIGCSPQGLPYKDSREREKESKEGLMKEEDAGGRRPGPCLGWRDGWRMWMEEVEG